MENFFKNLEAFGQALSAAAEEIDRNANRRRTEEEEEARQGSSDEGYWGQVPRPSAPSYADDSITEQCVRTPSVSSGYSSGSSSMRSSRQNSEVSFDDYFQNETKVVATTNSSAVASPGGRDPRTPTAGEALLGAVALGALGVGAYYAGKSLFSKTKVPIETFSACESILKEIKKDTQTHPIIGLDCQWVSYGRNRSNVALLQLSSYNDHIALIQLHKIGRIPSDLRDILANRNITKAGIETLQDAIYLEEDYGLTVQGTFDLRFLARDTKHTPAGLDRMAKDILGVDIGRHYEVMASDWEQDPLSDEQVTYAEAAVKASFDIFQKLMGKMFWVAPVERIQEYVKPMLDRKFR